jgi:hypothetical protein
VSTLQAQLKPLRSADPPQFGPPRKWLAARFHLNKQLLSIHPNRISGTPIA